MENCKKTVTDVLQELVSAIGAIRKETIGGILPECHKAVSDDGRARFQEALQDAAEFLHAQKEKSVAATRPS